MPIGATVMLPVSAKRRGESRRLPCSHVSRWLGFRGGPQCSPLGDSSGACCWPPFLGAGAVTLLAPEA